MQDIILKTLERSQREFERNITNPELANIVEEILLAENPVEKLADQLKSFRNTKDGLVSQLKTYSELYTIAQNTSRSSGFERDIEEAQADANKYRTKIVYLKQEINQLERVITELDELADRKNLYRYLTKIIWNRYKRTFLENIEDEDNALERLVHSFFYNTPQSISDDLKSIKDNQAQEKIYLLMKKIVSLIEKLQTDLDHHVVHDIANKIESFRNSNKYADIIKRFLAVIDAFYEYNVNIKQPFLTAYVTKISNLAP